MIKLVMAFEEIPNLDYLREYLGEENKEYFFSCVDEAIVLNNISSFIDLFYFHDLDQRIDSTLDKWIIEFLLEEDLPNLGIEL